LPLPVVEKLKIEITYDREFKAGEAQLAGKKLQMLTNL